MCDEAEQLRNKTKLETVCTCNFGEFGIVVGAVEGTRDNLPDEVIGYDYVAVIVLPADGFPSEGGTSELKAQVSLDGKETGFGRTVGDAIDSCLGRMVGKLRG